MKWRLLFFGILGLCYFHYMRNFASLALERFLNLKTAYITIIDQAEAMGAGSGATNKYIENRSQTPSGL